MRLVTSRSMPLNEPLFFVTLVTDTGRVWQEHLRLPPTIGHGYIDERGDRFRIVDVWINQEKHGGGVGEYGEYVYLEHAEGEADRPGELHPGWYRSAG